MALFVSSANIGPSLGSPVGEWLADNVNMGFAWMGWINVIIGFGKALHPALRAHPELILRCPQRTPSFWSSSQSTFPPTFMQDVINSLNHHRTLPRLVIAKAARGEHGDQVAEVLATTKVSVMKETYFVLTMALKIMVTEVSSVASILPCTR